MRFLHNLIRSIAAIVLTMACGVAVAGPGCEGKMWNPITDVDFRLMGGIKIAGFTLMKAPSHLGQPPDHKVSPICFCKNGWKTGFGLGLTYWLPSYLSDIARQAGCLGFLNGINILPGFLSLSSGQEYNLHSKGKDGVTNMQVHWAFADITAIAGNQLFESCDALTSALSIAYMTEPDFVFQNDVYSAIMTPQVALLSSNALLSQMACGLEAVANTLGDWRDFGMCGWKGTRLPLSANAIAKDMAQVSNMDVTLKYLTRSALMGTLLRTMGKDVACKPKWSPFYNPFQHRYQWAYPAKVSTRYNVDVLRWGLFIKPESFGGVSGMKALQADTNAIKSSRPAESNPLAGIRDLAQSVLDRIPKPLNYPTKEAGYMQVWEARTCCLMILTIETVVKKLAENLATQGGQTVKMLHEIYQVADKAYSFVQDPIGGALGLIGEGIMSVFETVGEELGEFADGLISGAAPATKSAVFRAGASSGIAQSLQ